VTLKYLALLCDTFAHIYKVINESTIIIRTYFTLYHYTTLSLHITAMEA